MLQLGCVISHVEIFFGVCCCASIAALRWPVQAKRAEAQAIDLHLALALVWGFFVFIVTQKFSTFDSDATIVHSGQNLTYHPLMISGMLACRK